jgi:hypothetical protein
LLDRACSSSTAVSLLAAVLCFCDQKQSLMTGCWMMAAPND